MVVVNVESTSGQRARLSLSLMVLNFSHLMTHHREPHYYLLGLSRRHVSNQPPTTISQPSSIQPWSSSWTDYRYSFWLPFCTMICVCRCRSPLPKIEVTPLVTHDSCVFALPTKRVIIFSSCKVRPPAHTHKHTHIYTHMKLLPPQLF